MKSEARIVRVTGADRLWDAAVSFPDDGTCPTARFAVALGDGRPSAYINVTTTDEGVVVDVYAEGGDQPEASCWVTDAEL